MPYGFGRRGARTPGPLLVREMLYQLSYPPAARLRSSALYLLPARGQGVVDTQNRLLP